MVPIPWSPIYWSGWHSYSFCLAVIWGPILYLWAAIEIALFSLSFLPILGDSFLQFFSRLCQQVLQPPSPLPSGTGRCFWSSETRMCLLSPIIFWIGLLSECWVWSQLGKEKEKGIRVSLHWPAFEPIWAGRDNTSQPKQVAIILEEWKSSGSDVLFQRSLRTSCSTMTILWIYSWNLKFWYKFCMHLIISAM